MPARVRKTAPGYVDAYVLPVPVKNLAAYRRMARKAGRIWREHGALAFLEARGDALDAPVGLPFPKLVKPRKGEAIIVSFILYASKAQRNAVLKKMMADPRLQNAAVLHDISRMTKGGFRTMVAL